MWQSPDFTYTSPYTSWAICQVTLAPTIIEPEVVATGLGAVQCFQESLHTRPAIRRRAAARQAPRLATVRAILRAVIPLAELGRPISPCAE